MLFDCYLLLVGRLTPLKPAKAGLCIISYHEGFVICNVQKHREW
jgi:hypothetical protein